MRIIAIPERNIEESSSIFLTSFTSALMKKAYLNKSRLKEGLDTRTQRMKIKNRKRKMKNQIRKRRENHKYR